MYDSHVAERCLSGQIGCCISDSRELNTGKGGSHITIQSLGEIVVHMTASTRSLDHDEATRRADAQRYQVVKYDCPRERSPEKYDHSGTTIYDSLNSSVEDGI